MRYTFTNSPRNLTHVPRSTYIHIRVLSGTLLISRDRQSLDDGGGLPITSTDGIVSLQWDTGYLWAQGQITAAEAVIILP